MSSGPEPGGASLRRDNGLVAERWSALAALDPAVSGDVLAALARRGVPGLVESRGRSAEGGGLGTSGPVAAPGDTGGTRHDLLWVDARLRDEARALLAAQFARLVTVLPADPDDLDQPGPSGGPEPRRGLPEVPGDPPRSTAGTGATGRPGEGGRLDEDEAWAQIVAGWDREGSADPVPPWPVNEDVTGSGAGESSPRSSVVRPARPAGTPPPPAGPRDHGPAEDPRDDHYVPPPPPPLPRLRRNTVAALVALALGIVLLFAPGLIGLPRGDGVAVTGIACIVGSVVALIHGMRDRGARGNGWDDGAVV